MFGFPLTHQGRRYADLSALTDEVARRGRGWVLDHPGQAHRAEHFEQGATPTTRAALREAAATLVASSVEPDVLRLALRAVVLDAARRTAPDWWVTHGAALVAALGTS